MKKQKTPITLKRIILLSFMLIGAFFTFSSAKAYNCCDSTNIYVKPDSTNKDSCSGVVYFSFKSDSCKIKYVTATGIYGGLVWDSLANAYKARYGVLRGNNLIIRGVFYNNKHDSVCSKIYTIYCPSCCDSVKMNVIADSLAVDSCKGTIYLSFDSLNVCGITNLSTTETSGQPIYNSTLKKYVVQYSTVRGNSISINAYFKNSKGDTICIKTHNVSCNNCCDSVKVYYEANTGVSDSCRGFVYFKFDTAYNPCGISFVMAKGSASQPIWDSLLGIYKAPYAVAKNENLTIEGYFYNSRGELICKKSVDIHCLEEFCCQGIIIIDNPSPPNPDCCGFLSLINNSPCEIMNVIIDNQIYDINNFGYSYCVLNGFSQSWVLYFVSANGDTVCTKVFNKDCSNNHGKMMKISSLKNNSSTLYPNPANNSFTVSYEMQLIGDVEFSIYNTNGLLVERKTVKNDRIGTFEEKINSSALPNGIYILRIIKENEIKNIRFTIVK